MTKPFPCGCGCVNCPQYGVSDVWTFDFSGLTAGSAAFISSTSGNHLFTDLNALGPVNFSFTSVTGTGLITALYTSGNQFPGADWRYTGIGILTNVRVRIEVKDDCGKVYLRSAQITINSNVSGDVIIAQFNTVTAPGSGNCGANVSAPIVFNSSGYLAATGTATADPP